MEIKAIFWDNDGVLVDTERLYFAATREILGKIGIDLTKEMYVDLILVKGKGAWHLAESMGYGKSELENLRNERNKLYSLLLGREQIIIEGAKEVLTALHGKFKMGIVTSSRKDHFDIIHSSSGLLKYFDFILTGEDYTKFKPDPEPYLIAVKKSGFKKEECLVIEDSGRGLESAKSAGLACYIISSEIAQGCNFSKADKILKNIRDLIPELI